MFIYQRELKKNLKSLIIWSIILGGLIIMTLSVYPQFTKDQQTMNDLLSAYPDSFKEAFGMNRLDIGTLLGFYGMQIHFMTTLLGSIYTVMLASNIIVKEENEKTIEFLLSKPISRVRVIGEKLLAVFTNVLLLNTVIVATSFIGFQFADEQVFLNTFNIIILSTLLLHMTFGAVSFLLSAVMKKSRTATAVSLGIVFISYLLSVISGISEELEVLKYVSLFKYVDAADLIAENAIQPLYLVIMLAIMLLGSLLTFVVYQKKDIA
ncbi:ABC-2 type transport system permease protein [Metabacillus crassostreae]|uniref:ABC transporter permease subunit n=1 Tax=Metabacillus crassostreae TaxID=929098 RepID=UPI001959CDFC|nr:ABC transporter permease subunit [Metabacillus crassostreae]MBM7602830.1 ABC-2 type transport system permease protein [Metabacillus crassostreae]